MVNDRSKVIYIILRSLPAQKNYSFFQYFYIHVNTVVVQPWIYALCCSLIIIFVVARFLRLLWKKKKNCKVFLVRCFRFHFYLVFRLYIDLIFDGLVTSGSLFCFLWIFLDKFITIWKHLYPQFELYTEIRRHWPKISRLISWKGLTLEGI